MTRLRGVRASGPVSVMRPANPDGSLSTATATAAMSRTSMIDHAASITGPAIVPLGTWAAQARSFGMNPLGRRNVHAPPAAPITDSFTPGARRRERYTTGVRS